MDGSTAWIVVPAFNEATAIDTVVRELRALGYRHVCVVDDGSTDGTASVAHAAGAYVVRHATNLGQGAALQTGIAYALRNDADYICTFDGDGQHAAGEVGDLLAALRDNGADVALGSRFLGAAPGISFFRRLLLKAALSFTRLHSGLDITDTHNGLRAFTRHAAETIEITQPGMAHASEILQQIGRAKLRFVEVPSTVSYSAYSKRKGQSGFDSVKILLDLLYRSIASPR